MVRIVVFDSGLGSLSVIRMIQKVIKSEIIYYADQKNFPYGLKSKKELRRIITSSIQMLCLKFSPDIIIIGSNTPSLLFPDLLDKKILGVLPPLQTAAKLSQTKKIVILATKSVVKSRDLSKYIKENSCEEIKFIRINSSQLVELVETGKFLDKKEYCRKKIKKILKDRFLQNKVDVATLSSTHLPFLRKLLEKEFPDVVFLDPAYSVAQQVSKLLRTKKSKRNSLRIFTSGNAVRLQKNLQKLGIKNKVNYFVTQ